MHILYAQAGSGGNQQITGKKPKSKAIGWMKWLVLAATFTDSLGAALLLWSPDPLGVSATS